MYLDVKVLVMLLKNTTSVTRAASARCIHVEELRIKMIFIALTYSTSYVSDASLESNQRYLIREVEYVNKVSVREDAILQRNAA